MSINESLNNPEGHHQITNTKLSKSKSLHIQSHYSLLTISLRVTLLIYFVIALVTEILMSHFLFET